MNVLCPSYEAFRFFSTVTDDHIPQLQLPDAPALRLAYFLLRLLLFIFKVGCLTGQRARQGVKAT